MISPERECDMATERKPEMKFDWKSITPEDSPRTPPELASDPEMRDLSTASVAEGDEAFDFELPVYDFSDGSERLTGETFNLSEVARERPVALVFGSYT
jgi:hypothetical protein